MPDDAARMRGFLATRANPAQATIPILEPEGAPIMFRTAAILLVVLSSRCASRAAIAADALAAKQPADAPAAQQPADGKKSAPEQPPTLANVAYGNDPRQVLDFYQCESKTPTPVVFFIHGGGWRGGDKAKGVDVKSYHRAGISVVSIEYRFTQQADAAGIKPPVQWPLGDAARALQFVRSKASEWKLDKTRIGATGGSAGAASSLWLAFHDDMADPKSDDPVARESTRLHCAAVNGAQTCFDPRLVREWMPNANYGGHAFGFNGDPAKKQNGFAQWLAHRDEIMPWIKEYSPYHLVTSDDPPVALYYGSAPEMGKDTKDPTHSANYGVPLQEKCREVGVSCELIYPNASGVEHPTPIKFLVEKLTSAKP